METLVVFTNELSPRASTTEEERIAAEYLRTEFEAMGYDASIQPFDVRVLSRAVPLLTITSPMKLDIEAVPMSMTTAGEATAEFADVGKALPSDISAEGLSGKIALIERGGITFQEKITNVTEAGAVGAVVYNNEPGPFAGALSEESSIPAMSISQEDGGAVKALMDDEAVTANITLIYTENSQNVIADKPGTANDGRIVILGGHYDTVPNVSGANDNGSGTATILTIARQIADREYPFTVRFIAFGAEELGLYGSKYYISQLSAEETESTIAMLNFDALATGPVTGILGTIELMKLVDSYAKENDIDVEMRFNLAAGTSSDHASFDQVGIPNVFFLGDDFSRIHTPEDTLEFVDPKLLGTSAALGIALLDILAQEG
jgi:aminopeptidase YwaD